MRRAGWKRLGVVACALSVAAGAGACGDSDGAKDTSPTSNGKSSVTTSSDDVGRINPLGQRELPRIRDMLTRLIAGVNERDPSICTEVYTKRYREELMGRKGPAALTECRRQVKAAGFKGSLVKIERVEIHRTQQGVLTGRVQVIQQIEKGGLIQADFRVVRTGPTYRITQGTGKQIAQPQTKGGGSAAS